jgi:hypothetical protein
VARRVIADTTAFVSFQLPVYWIVLIIAGATFWQIAAASVTARIILLVSGRPYGGAARLAPQAVPSNAASRRARARLSACPRRATIVTGSAVTGSSRCVAAGSARSRGATVVHPEVEPEPVLSGASKAVLPGRHSGGFAR